MMRDIVTNLKKNVDLKSYSKSDEFAGFFNLNNEFSKTNVNDAITFFDEFWKAIGGDNVVIASTLEVDGSLIDLIDLYEYNKSDIDHYIKPLIAKGIIKINDNFGDSLVKEDFFVCDFNQNDSENLHKIFFVIMGLGGIHGHLFVIFEKEDIIVYPHDDRGFGVISRSKNNKWVNVFFDLLDTKHNIDVHRK